MKDRKLASRYAGALLSVFPDPSQAESADSFLTEISRAMKESEELRDILLDPAYSRTSRVAVLHAMAKERGMPGELLNFLSAIIDHNRAGAIPAIAEVFHEEREKAMGVVPAVVTTAEPLSDPLKARAKGTLENLTGKKVRLSCQVEPDLLGGAVTKIGSKVYDGSLRNQLQKLRRRMAQE
jgi:F-type H+-transporting ATPase subunit delta